MLNRFTGYKRLLALSALSGGAAPVERTATGNPLTFGTDLARPLKSLLIPFTPVQSGTGDPSPQNIRPILPWNGLTVFGGGKNLLKLAESEMVSIGWNRFFPNPIKKAGTYTISCKHPFGGETGTAGARVVLTDEAKSDPTEIKILTAWTFGQSASGNKATFTLTEEEANGNYLLLFQCQGRGTTFSQFENAELQIEVGETATAYEPYKPITETDISFPSPVYGGTLDVVSGVLNVPVAFAEFDGSDDESWNVGEIDANKSRAFIALTGAPKTGYNREIIGNYIKPTESAQSSPDLWTANINASGNILIGIDPSITTVEAWKAYLAEHPLQIVYPLATPQEITLTPEQITALKGDNTIWSDADGSMTAVYLVSAAYADSHPVGGLGSGLLGFGSGNPDPDEPGEPDDEPVEPDQPADDQPEEP